MNNTNQASSGSGDDSSGLVYKVLRLFTVVKSGEASTMLLLTFNLFLLMTAYYIVKPVRSALVVGGVGAEGEAYLNAAIAVLLVFVVKIFSRISTRLPRQKLIGWVTAFFISNLVVFYFVSLSGISSKAMGVIFFIWMGIFNVMVIAQFWSFANDIYIEEAGKRLFPLVAFGAAVGGTLGSQISEILIRLFGLYQTMLASGALLGLCIVLTMVIHNREIAKRSGPAAGTAASVEAVKPLSKGGGFQLLFKSRYLIFLAFFVLFLNFVNSNGQFILHSVFHDAAVAAVESGTAEGLSVEEHIGVQDANFMKYQNIFGLLLQLFLVSRIFKWVGVRGALFILPVVALGGYFLIALGASLLLIKWVKVVENGSDYTLMNTTRHALFLITSREEKYKAKAAIDTFFHRAGDVFNALLVLIGTTMLAFSTEMYAAVNVALVLVWIGIGILIYKEHKRRTMIPS